MIIELIEKKKRGEALSAPEIHAMIHAYVNKEIADYQMSAFLMAVWFQGMIMDEMIALCDAMMHSGEVLDLSDLDGVTCDKHSTGGVGDKTSIVLVPLVAACGGIVAKMSGRGLGHTGGTIDKLECGHRWTEQSVRRSRSDAVCAAGCDRNGGQSSADRDQHPLKEACCGQRRDPAGCKIRRGRLHEDKGRCAGAGRYDVCDRCAFSA